MTSLKIQVTAAGRAALVNATNTGTMPVTVAQIGVTSTPFTPAADGTDTALPGEFKRLATFGGAAVAPDTIHTTIRDDSANTYSLYGFGLYLADGTLLALYGQAGVILEKSAQAIMLLATDVIFADIDATALTFGDTSFLNPPATTEVQGVVEIATDAEAIAGTDAVRAVTPKGLAAKLVDLLGAGAPSAFVKSLLTAASAAVFRAALAIKGAALKDEGAGNGLDADLLDGQHGAYYRAYGSLTGVPASFPPSPHTHPMSDILNLTSTLSTLAPLASPALTGTPTAPTASALNNTTQIATTAFVQQVVANLINGSPGAMDTLKELADAMGDDPNFAATVTNAIAGKVAKSGDVMSGTLQVPTLGVGVSPSAQLDVATGVGRVMVRNDNGTGFSTIDSVNSSNSVYAGLNFTATSYNFSGGNVRCSGMVTAANYASAGFAIERGPGQLGAKIWKETSQYDLWYFDQLNSADIVFRTASTSEKLRIRHSDSAVVAAGAMIASGGFRKGSSRRIKRRITPLESVRHLLAATQPVSYYLRKEFTDYPDQLHYGFVAEDLLNQIPCIVHSGDERVPYTVAQDEMIPLLVQDANEQAAAIEEHDQTIAQLEATVTAISRRLAALENAT